MTADHFANTIADTLFGSDQQTGRHLMRTAVRLLAHGKPVTLTELSAAAGLAQRAPRRDCATCRRCLPTAAPHQQPAPRLTQTPTRGQRS